MEKFPGIYEFFFTSPEETLLLQYVVKNKEDIEKIQKDFIECFEEVLQEEIKEHIEDFEEIKKSNNNITRLRSESLKNVYMDIIAYKIDELMVKKGWDKPNAIKRDTIDFWSKIDLVKKEIVPFYKDHIFSELELKLNKSCKKVIGKFADKISKMLEYISTIRNN